MKKVKDHLNEQKFWDIFTISEDASLFEAAALMYKNKIGALMINEAGSEEHLSKSSVVGILTERDLVYALSGGSKTIESKNVKDVMTRKLIFTCPDTDNSEAKKIMLENQIRHLPVFSGENLVGIVSMRDVFKA
ncbi:CBS domain-containing protein [Gammaproteobacteria bacterium]|jgi:CBS domain-containing protein|nr:CBS domain-containing protein [Gammaproteobacteria bacterium]MDB3867442.1 CBS domain-containing protein [Gammaproteobacteria bacterium]MDB4850401.1 CBS domain-containing protein [Gammaproteobacteria bacterium]MDC0885351.1 CBS domain-containing protein [Gammaproteobacteria bacterium]MDC0914109.1 CBS domain-containing protein [Gammaproteobacteria bacterium]|tara:strand:- start:78 stop:479 length:402 start_codon:yes stop_codon:yes gene_type:complete